MRIIGRRWAKLSDVQRPDYIPRLNSNTNQYVQTQNQTTQVQNQLMSNYGLQGQSNGILQNNINYNSQYGQNYIPQQFYNTNTNSQNNNLNNEQRSDDYTHYTHEYLLDNGQIVTTEQAYDLASQGLLEGVGCAVNKGTKYIRSINDGNPNNNLQDLPEF